MQKFVLVPVEPTAQMEEDGCQGYLDADGKIGIMHKSSMGHAYRAMLAAAPQPPALGGDAIPSLGFLVAGSLFCETRLRAESLYRNGKYQIVELADRAHVARLQAELSLFKDTDLKTEALREQEAEIARLQAELSSANADKHAYAQNAIDLQAEVERLNAQLSSEQDRVMATIGQYAKFEARNAELEGLLREALELARRNTRSQWSKDIVGRIDAALAGGKEHE